MILPLLHLALCAPLASPGAPSSETLTLFAETVHTAAGDPIRNGSVTVSGGKIRAVGPGSPPEGALVVTAITPGMVDLSARIASNQHAVEQSNEIQPGLRVADTLDPFASDWDRLRNSGITTAMVPPPDWNVIGGLMAVLKTGGEPSVEARTLKADAALRGAIGSQPSAGNHPAFGRPTDFFSRRPTTRMGVEWEWRKAMYDALASEGRPERAFPGSDRLLQVLAGELPVVIGAWATQDIRTAVFLKEEMAANGKPGMRLVIDAGAEAWKEPKLLQRNATPVILPPFSMQGRTTEGAFMAFDVARELLDLGIPVALSGHSSRAPEDRLAMQGAYARMGGLSLPEAIAATTIVPARIIGVDGRVGSIEVGKDADLVLWSGEPFEMSSRIVGVVLDGVLVLDPQSGS
jgi:imidazolonepropionase-like amidohydrolase